MRKLKELSVFFPLYNEQENVEPLTQQALKVLPGVANKFEILLINDGSTDKTKEVAEKLEKKHKEVKLISQPNKGYGGALKTGFKNSQYGWVFFSDGDLQFDLSELDNFIEHTDEHDLIIGYRKKRAEGFKRILIVKLLKIWNKFFFDFPLYIKDPDCAFKLIKKDVLKKIGPLSLSGGLISTELLLKAHNEGFDMHQIPVNHYERKYGTSTGDSAKVIKKAIIETWQLLNVLPNRKEFLSILFFWTVVFLLLLPVALSIDFMQNDDYTHYRLVSSFLQGNFKLDPYIGATFYVQGVLATIFALFFGLSRIPVLTLAVSIGGVCIFNIILWKYFSVSWVRSMALSFLIFLTPWHLYSTWGFMTENYFLFFFMCSLYFIFDFSESDRVKSFILANIFIWLSYGIRQFGMFTSVALFLFLLTKKNFKLAAWQGGLTLALLAFHFYVFPKTPQMYDSRLLFTNPFEVDRVFTIVYMIGIYLGVFLLPYLISAASNKDLFKRKYLLLLLLIPLLIFLFEKKFEPENIVFTTRSREGEFNNEVISPEFPYLKNVFTRKGFYEDNLPGDKYIFPGYFDLFNTLEIIGKLAFFITLVIVLINYKKVNKFTFWYIAVFAGVLLVSPRIFDRYLLPLVVVGAIMLVSITKPSKTGNIFIAGFVAFWLFLGYQFTADLITVNKYIWNESLKIHSELGVPKNKISADHSWRQLYPNNTKNRIYHFTYADFGKAQRSSNYELIGEHRIKYPLSIYKEPYIYLYKNWGAVE